MANVLKGTTTEGLHYKKLREPAVTYFSKLIEQTETIDPPSLATVTGGIAADIAIDGAALGDRVELFPPYDLQGIMAFGYVSAADTVDISFFNPTGATVDLASGDWKILVIRA